MATRPPLLKQVDQWVFRKLDSFRSTPAHGRLAEQYSSLEEHEQTLVKGAVLGGLLLVPLLILGALWWHNAGVRGEINLRAQAVERMQSILAQNGQASSLTSAVAAPQTFVDTSDLTSRLTGALAGSGLDAAKVRVNNFTTDSVSPQLARVEADFGFTGLNTAQLVGLFTNLITRERFRVSTLNIKRNPSSNMLDGDFHGVHFGQISVPVEEDN
jgi:hypothetical protein